MTYDLVEASTSDAKPVELYEFTYSGVSYYYTSADKDVTDSGRTYLAVPLDRTDITQDSEMNKRSIDITLPRDAAVGELFRVSPPSSVVNAIVKQFHEGDGEIITIWIGRCLSGSWSDHWLKLHCESAYTSLKRTSHRRHYSIQCPHILYGTACGVSDVAFRQQITRGVPKLRA